MLHSLRSGFSNNKGTDVGLEYFLSSIRYARVIGVCHYSHIRRVYSDFALTLVTVNDPVHRKDEHSESSCCERSILPIP
jgi:hypothetical protein